MSELMPSRRAVVGGLALAAFGVLILGVLAAPGLDVISRGHFVGYTEHDVERVRAFGSWTFLAAPNTNGDTDVVNGIVLGFLGGVAALAALLAWLGRLDSHLRWFFTLTALGATLASVAEVFELDETLGYNVQWVDNIPGLTAENLDLIILGPAAIVFVWFFRDVLRRSVDAMWFWAVGISIFFVTLVLDTFFDTPLEDKLEVVASLFLLAGFALLSAETLYVEMPTAASSREGTV